MAVKGSVEITLSLKKQQQTLASYRKVETKLKKSNEAIENSFNKASTSAKNADKGVKSLTSSFTKSIPAAIGAGTGFNKASTSAKNADKGIKSLTSSFTKFIPAAVGVGTALVGAKKAFDFSKEFARFEQSTKAMEMQFGVSSDTVLEKLGKVAKGTISNAELISSANRAMALNVTKDLDQMAKLMEVARIRGQAMGLDTTQAFSDLVTGIGRASPLILDNLGIITKGWDKQAKAAGRAMDASFILDKVLSDGQTMLKKTGDVALTNAEKFQLMEAQLSDLRIELGEKLLPVVLKVTDKFNKMIGSLLRNNKGPIDAKAMSEGKEVLKEYIKVFEDAEVGIAKQGSKYIDLKSKMKLDELKKEYANINKEMASIYPIEEAKEWLELSDRIDKNLKQFTPTGGTKKYPGGLSKPELKKTSLEGNKTKSTSIDFQAVKSEAVRQRVELSYEIRQLELEAQEETEKQKIDLVKLQYEKERNVILNQEALNGNLRKALKEKEISEIAEIEKRYLAEKDKENERNNRREERRIEDLERLKKDELNSAVSNLRVFASQNKAFSEIYKTAAISRTAISTYEGAQNSYTSLSSIPVFGPILGASAATAAVVGGLARIQQIRSQKFADGGIVPGNGNTDSVPSMLTPGEMVLNREQQQRLLEGGTGTRIETVHIHVNGSGSPQETAATIEETLHNIKDQSMRMSTI